MQKLTALDPISTPLNSTLLIEASAGTGKTFTMASLYLRLLLQAGENCFFKPLEVEQILVVTFTEAATQELRERIRHRIHLAKKQLTQYAENKNKQVFYGTENEILADLVDSLELPVAIQRLKIAEQNMDLAAIYTIHGFCRRMLVQYAFNSGIHFNLQLVKDETELLTRFSNELWREHFYNLSFSLTNFIHRNLKSPTDVLQKIRKFVTSENLNVELNEPHLLQLEFNRFLSQYIEKNINEINQLKTAWIESENEIQRLIEKAKTQKLIKGASYKANHLPGRYEKIRQWAQDETDFSIPEPLSKYFSQSAVDSYLTKNEPVNHAVFKQADSAVERAQSTELYVKVILYHYIQWMRDKLDRYKASHQEKSFDDLLRLLKEAVVSPEHGNELVKLIRYQYPFAMIDEFQDTDAQQYQIFSKIYIESAQAETGFIMIGDPKQAIYQFRGADIFTYLKAAQQAKYHFTLGKNYRSEGNLIHAVNQLFNFSSAQPFLYENIEFSSVEPGKAQGRFILNEQQEAPLGVYLGEEPSDEQLAETCANCISQWLQLALRECAGIQTAEKFLPLEPKDIAVLVRNAKEAELIKNALQARQISSVYLSDKSNVFDCNEAKELLLILQACLNPFSERNIVNAIATAIFCLTGADIQHIKQHETDWEKWIDRFVGYQRSWRQQGVLAMLHQLFLAEQIPQKLINMPNGERRVTDLFHLAELLQEATTLNESDAALLRWFERQIRGENTQDENIIRLESEQQLVKIVTIHKSKGLEYNLVWLPFISAKAKVNPQHISTYYNAQAQAVQWDMDACHNDEVIKERLAEEMRLLYVALTRAKYHLAMALPDNFTKNWNALLYALTRGKIGIQAKLTDEYQTKPLLDDFAQRISPANIHYYQTDEIQGGGYQQKDNHAQYVAQEFHGKIERDWTISSFTSLTQMHEWNSQKGRHEAFNPIVTTESAVNFSLILDEAKDIDLTFLPKINEDENNFSDIVTGYRQGYSPFDFPHGINVGTALHRFFEKNEFNQPISDEYVKNLCQTIQLSEEWKQPLIQWIEAILTTPLFNGEPLNLAQLDKKDCIKEMQFYLKLEGRFKLHSFNRLLQKYHTIKREPYLFDEIQGMLRGFIDLVFRHESKYYVLDYKSNFLGKDMAFYARSQLTDVMKNHHYDLQYLLYTLAIHRYLKQRVADYDYDSHFGGVIYCFLRGMNGRNPDYGIYSAKPAQELIEGLDNLF
ncbi:exodeoxyribonuclease V subunit beta [Basfia succiniciproducens]|uniref:RecBCD enzyme subunit RecB n=1 Tax=Basfia succiniciproducens TaxID=653940 RepID=A0A1G5AC07_9PAST|nr:exodeoxyribonuclease V subunit beta [Basfia succiniciproducens]QIM68481.1 exodeoxyribonuclease V subunit beta [Basfia succiniciproducens]SCX75399.1 DNA helicase/exodeoxyribonuclease V, beta subunit [Basfia succiniciproducens]